MQTLAESPHRELELLEYRRERLNELLSEGILSTKMACQLRDQLVTVERQVELIKAYRLPAAPRHAA